MTGESRPIQRSPLAKLLVIDPRGELSHLPRRRFVELLRPGDLIVANDAATLPASLKGEHLPSGKAIEVRLLGRRSLDPHGIEAFLAVAFGAADFHTPLKNALCRRNSRLAIAFYWDHLRP